VFIEWLKRFGSITKPQAIVPDHQRPKLVSWKHIRRLALLPNWVYQNLLPFYCFQRKKTTGIKVIECYCLFP
jgi:hypothetical protein